VLIVASFNTTLAPCKHNIRTVLQTVVPPDPQCQNCSHQC